MRKNKPFHPAKIDTLLDDIVDGRLRFPMDDTLDLRKPKLREEGAQWVRHLRAVANELKDVRTFVVQRHARNIRQEEEVFETCKALAQANLLRLPYETVWVETQGSFNWRMTNDPEKYSKLEEVPVTDSLGILAWDLKESTKMFPSVDPDPELEGKEGIVFWVFLRIPTKEGLRWYDMLYGNIAMQEDVAEGKWVTYTVPAPMPNIIEAVERAYKLYVPPEWDGPLEDNLAETGVYLGTRLLTTFLTSLNTSWVRKTKKDPGRRPRASARVHKKRNLVGKKRLNHRSYILIDSFEDSIEDALKKDGNGQRKKMATHTCAAATCIVSGSVPKTARTGGWRPGSSRRLGLTKQITRTRSLGIMRCSYKEQQCSTYLNWQLTLLPPFPWVRLNWPL